MRRRIEGFQGFVNPSFFPLKFSFSWLPLTYQFLLFAAMINKENCEKLNLLEVPGNFPGLRESLFGHPVNSDKKIKNKEI
jgi:hypothetical protein